MMVWGAARGWGTHHRGGDSHFRAVGIPWPQTLRDIGGSGFRVAAGFLYALIELVRPLRRFMVKGLRFGVDYSLSDFGSLSDKDVANDSLLQCS